MKTTVVVRVEVVVVGPGVVGEVADQTADLEREEEVGAVGTTMMTTPMGVPVVVQDAAVAVVAGLEGDEEELHRRRHPPGHRLPQTICSTRTFSSVSPSYTLRLSGLYLVARR